MKTAVLLSAVLLGGCASAPEKITVPTVVKVPIAVPCKVEDPIPPTLRFSPPYQTAFEGTRDLLGDREVQNAYVNELRIALKSCK